MRKAVHPALKQRVLSCLCLPGALLVLSASAAAAQESTTPRFEVGGQLTMRRNTAGGARFGWNVTRHVAIESQVDIYPGDTPYDSKLQAVFGVKVGRHGQRYGVFGKLRPGVVNRVDLVTKPGSFCGIPEGCRNPDGGNWFALDAGMVIEAYSSHWFIARLDISDMFVPIRETDKVGNVLFVSSHDPQVSAGIGFRF